jgi:anti-sigma factor RsiW
MSGSIARPSEEALHAYVDGFLGEAERAGVERYLGENPAEALRLEAYRQQNAALQALRALPDARPFALPDFSRRRSWTSLARRAVAALLLLAAGSAGGWWLHGRTAPGDPLWLRLVQQAELAHRTFVPEVVHPVEVTSAQEPHLRTWLSRRLGAPVNVPTLRTQGYDLVGGRLLPARPGPAAQFMYQDTSGSRLTLYVLAAPTEQRETAFRYLQSGTLWICYWTGGSMDFALTGELSRERLIEIAKVVFMQLNNMNPPTLDTW